MESLGRHVSPLVAPSTAHSRTLSKTTVTSANLAGVGDVNLPLTPAGLSAGKPERQVPRGVHTPHRRPSVLDQQQQPTPRGSLQWPSTHRSFSSTAATRDSSRHSQIADRVNITGVSVSAALSQHGRARSSASHTPMSSHDEHSEQRSSAMSGAGRRGRSLGRHPNAPPLVDVGDSPSFSVHSAVHSVYTTALCTPRDGTGAASTHAPTVAPALPGEGVPTPVPSPPPLYDFEAEAHQLTREQLEDRVEQMRAANVVLRTSVLRLRESLATLQEGMRANYADLERRQESIANMLLRRLEATKRRRSKLVAHLRAVEADKASQEAKLRNTTQSINDLSKHLKREEQEIANRLQHRLARLHTQRQQLDHVLEEQTSSLQQLERLVQEVEDMDQGDAATDLAARPTSAPSSAVHAAVEGPLSVAAPSVMAAAAGLASCDSSPVPSVMLASVPAGANAAAASASLGSSSLFAPAHERSSSRMSAASSTTGGAAATTAEVAYDPTAMIRYLEEEIVAAEGLRTEAVSRAEKYAATRERLERRLAREREQRAEQQSRTEALKQQLQDASTAVNEKATAQEMAMEMEVDRHLNSSRLGGDLVSSASSACATPKLRAISTAPSRGNSTSPALGRPWSGHTAGAPDLESRPHDSFLLPSSSTCITAAAPSAAAGGGGTGVGDVAARPVSVALGEAPPQLSSSVPPHGPASRDETTFSSEGTPHTRLLVQNTSRMAAPRPVTSAESTPRRTPLPTPSLSGLQGPVL